MKVECCRIVNPTTGELDETSPWLTIGRTYAVLELSCSLDGPQRFRLIGDDQQAASLHGSSQFRIVSSAIPPVWRVNIRADGSLVIGPEEWFVPGFWERYFDGDAAAVRTFELLKDQIQTAE